MHFYENKYNFSVIKMFMKNLKWLSLFANVGIAEFYLKDLWIDIVVANELLEKRAKLYNFFHPETHMISWDITDEKIFSEIIKTAKDENCDFLIATPPCQWMSVAGKMLENDPRNSLIIKAVEAIKFIKLKYALIENVPAFLTTYIMYNSEKILIPDYIKSELSEDYDLKFQVLDASKHWTPQYRKRAFVLISRKDCEELFFPEEQKEITVREAIWHLPSLESSEKSDIKYHYAKNHSDNHILWMKNTPTGKTALDNEKFFPQKENGDRIKWFKTTYKRIEWDKPAPTITMCNWAISSQNNVHPWRELENWQYSDARVLTLKELFILTGLPDDIEIPDWASDNFIRQVIGEWIPPKLVYEILKWIKNKRW